MAAGGCDSASNLGRLYADAGWRLSAHPEIHLVASGSQSGLGVVGPTPIQLAQQDSAAVYTWPQTTHNRLGSLAVNGKTKLADHWQLEASAYMRSLRQRHVDGNDGNFESCSKSSSFGGDLCLQDDAFGTSRRQQLDARRLPQPVHDRKPDGPDVSGSGRRDLRLAGPNFHRHDHARHHGPTDRRCPAGRHEQLFHGRRQHRPQRHRLSLHQHLGPRVAEFRHCGGPHLAPASGTIIHTLGNLGYAPANLGATIDYYGLYAVDALDLTTGITATAGFRLNAATIATRDRSGINAELNGSHGYAHLNPLAGITWKIADGITAFGGYSQANRIPTPLELDCASQTQPCLLEGSLVADPALKQVVSETSEAGVRGTIQNVTWSASLFRTDSTNDIVSLASVIQGRGYFANVPLTRRQGVDLAGQYQGDGWSSHVSYSYLDADYEFTGALASPNNPQADANGNVTVTPGRHLPVNPANSFRAGGEDDILPGLTIGGDLVFTGSQYYDGDNANQNAKLPSHWTVNLRAQYQFAWRWQLFGVINNLLNRHDASFGTYFSPDDTVGLVTPALTDPRSITLGAADFLSAWGQDKLLVAWRTGKVNCSL